MAIILPSGFVITNNEPVDSRLSVADSASRLSLSVNNVYEGITVYQRDSNIIYVLTDATAPSSASSWVALISNTSSSIATSASYSVTSSYALSGNGSFTGSFTGSFIGDGAGLTNIPASGITGLNLSQISTGSISASVSTNDNSLFSVTSGSESYFNIKKDFSVTQGYHTSASDGSHAEGYETDAYGTVSHTEGYQTTASGNYSHAEGLYSFAIGNGSHAEGLYTTTIGGYSHAEGSATTAAGLNSHAEGQDTVAYGHNSHAEGLGTVASGSAQLAIGQFNTHGNSTSIFVIGNGNTNNSRSDLALFNPTNIQLNAPVTASSFTGSFTGTLTGTASYSSQNLSSSYAETASYAPAYLPLTGGTISGDLTVIGTASFAYTTASIVQVGSNVIILNTDYPSVRFGGISVIDSGSFGNSSTGSLFWDSYMNRWVYANPSGSAYDGGLLLSGPKNTSGLGNETGMIENFVAVGQSTDHLQPGTIFNSGSITQVTGSLFVTAGVTGSFTGSFVGNASGLTGIFPVTTDAQILVSTGSILAARSVTGDIAITNAGVTTIQTGAVTFSKIQTLSQAALIGATGSLGGVVQEIPIIEAYVPTGSAFTTLLETTTNWDINGVYIGSTITGTYQGQSHLNNDYWFTAVADNNWIRLIRG
jgi:hypothetical protein